MTSFASPEIEAAWTQIDSSLDHLVGLLSGLDEAQLNWRPPVSDGAEEHANSLYVLAAHTLGMIEEAMLFMLGGEPGARDRAGEFAASGSSSRALEERWAGLRERIPAVLAKLDASALDGTYQHSSRGALPGREVLYGAITHVAIHAGHADVTRDLLPPS